MNDQQGLPGFIAGPPSLVLDGHVGWAADGPTTVSWGDCGRQDGLVVLSPVTRRRSGHVAADEIARAVRVDPASLTSLLPPFAVAATVPGGVRMLADSMGFRHLFLAARSSGAPAMASSALALARSLSTGLDREGLAVQSLLGWQLGDRTLFEGVRKLPAGVVADLSDAGVAISSPPPVESAPIRFECAVKGAAQILRDSLGALLDDHPDAVLQLTGGMDSRLLLSAVPRSRRSGLRAMTLAVPGSGDVATAAAIATRYRLRHTVHGLADIQALEPEHIWRLCTGASERLDAMADPLALAGQHVAEQAFEQGVRISGLGGEIARGFYYLGRVHERPYTRADAVRLADWRMFVNESVEPGLLDRDFAQWARGVAHDAVYTALREGGDEWLRATDWLYLRHRMQRWAGATDLAVSAQRTVINPMLDAEFISIAGRLCPDQKRGARFLAALQVELDPDLARMPLDGRSAPMFYADPPPHAVVVNSLALARKGGRKLAQRVRQGNRPPAGGTVVAAKVVQHWRAEPGVLNPLRESNIVDSRWVDKALGAELEPRPSSVAFVTNLLVGLR